MSLMGAHSRGVQRLLLPVVFALLVGAATPLSDIESELSAFSLSNDYTPSPKTAARQRVPQPATPPAATAAAQPRALFQPPSFFQQPYIIQQPAAPPRQPTLISLNTQHSSHHHRHHHHYHRNRREQYRPQQPYLQQQPPQPAFQQGVSNTCQARALAQRQSCGVRFACFITACEVTGAFSSRQCDPASAQCWCTDLDGQEVDRTRMRVKSAASTGALSAQCEQLRATATAKLQATPHPQKQQEATGDARTLSLAEIRAIIVRSAQQTAAQQANAAAAAAASLHEKPIPAATQAQAEAEVHAEVPSQPSQPAQPAHSAKRPRSCASYCHGQCAVSMDISGCLKTCSKACQ